MLAANVDIVFLVCGLDRVVKPGRIDRGATLARDAGAISDRGAHQGRALPGRGGRRGRRRGASPGIEVIITSAREGVGLDALRERARDLTVTMLGESGAGKSSLVNALLGEDVAAIGDVRPGDSKGRHTTTSRDMHVLPTGGVLIDTPGIRGVGLWVEPEAVAETFADIDDLAGACRFTDCGHDTEPGCAVTAAVEAGSVTPARLEAWRALQEEATTSPHVALTYEQARPTRSSPATPRPPNAARAADRDAGRSTRSGQSCCGPRRCARRRTPR